MDKNNYNKGNSPITPADHAGFSSGVNSTPSDSYRNAGSFSGTPGFASGPMNVPPRTPQSVRDEIRRTRHKKELPLYFLLIILGLIAVCVILFRETQGEGILVE